MRSLNRIGIKLGFAGVIGIMLAVGMIANQAATEPKVREANRHADDEAQISENALIAESEMRNMQLAVRGVRLARSTKDFDKRRSQFRDAKAAQAKLLEVSIALSASPEEKRMYGEITRLTDEYAVGADEQAQQQKKMLELNEKRATLATDWDRKADALIAATGNGGGTANLDRGGY
ncbi:hypothetical protein BJ122_11328 [Rhodopseudomonas faecalis]|uniref:Uncharacterized protein n=1 Tax=Rhodopseudomonas faecalis TaxID=99655 RepID=A0A318TC09_9BRAD|nr:hypothetical protein [Rhodopseudomonas faecalis]PYF02244.1 hypothetical protein BJ122_11328 [Rhodopseudomonas faecalis]